jgi:hypothetical protein
MCDDAKHSDIIEKPLEELERLGLEHRGYWERAVVR